MTKNELIDQIMTEITAGNQILHQIPSLEIERIIFQTEKWFYMNYNKAAEPQQYFIPNDTFLKPEFRSTRTIRMPECVISVYEVKEIGGGANRILGIADPDFSGDRLIAAELYLGKNLGDELIYLTASMQFYDLTRAFFVQDIQYDYNLNSQKLKLLGRNPRKDLYVAAYVKIDAHDLYEDYYFIRYCSAMAKVSLGTLLITIPFPLPGGVLIDGNSIKSDGQQELEQLKQEINDQQPADFFNMFI